MTKHLKLFSILSYVVVVMSLAGLVLLHAILARTVIAQAVQVAAVGLMLWARFTFGFRSFHFAANPTRGRLVTNGPYRFVRHPIYAAVLLWVLAAVVTHWSLATVLLGIIAIAATLVRITCEEHVLLAQYPDYASYRQRTYRLVPLVC